MKSMMRIFNCRRVGGLPFYGKKSHTPRHTPNIDAFLTMTYSHDRYGALKLKNVISIDSQRYNRIVRFYCQDCYNYDIDVKNICIFMRRRNQCGSESRLPAAATEKNIMPCFLLRTEKKVWKQVLNSSPSTFSCFEPDCSFYHQFMKGP